MMLHLPPTPEEWLKALGTAEIMRTIAAHVTGIGPRIDVERCHEILEAGRTHGYHVRQLSTVERDIVIQAWMDWYRGTIATN